MKSNLTSEPLELLLGIVCLVGVIYIGPSIMAAYFCLAKPPRTDLKNIEEGEIKIPEEESMRVEQVGKAKAIEEAEIFEDVGNHFSEAERLKEVKSFEDIEEFKNFDDDDGMIKGTTRLREEAYTTEHIRVKDDDWEIVWNIGGGFFWFWLYGKDAKWGRMDPWGGMPKGIFSSF